MIFAPVPPDGYCPLGKFIQAGDAGLI